MTSSDRGQDLELSKHEDPSMSRPRAATTSSKASASQPKSSPDRPQKHSRARSELPSLSSRNGTKSSSELVKGSSSKDGQRRSAQTSSTSSVGRSSVGTQLSRGSGSRYLQSHLSMSSVGVEDESSSQSEADEPDPQECPTNPAHMISVLRPATADTTDTRDSQAHRTFLNMEEESEDESNDEDTPSPSSDIEKHKTPGPDAGSTLGSLVDRLLSLPTTKQEANFLPIFLCLYRKFATPKKVLTTIVERFEEIEKSKTVPTPSNERLRSGREFTKVGEQLRYLQVLAQWTAEYPGDFADPRTKGILIPFVGELEKSRTFAAAAKEINNHLAVAAQDDDASWAYRDDEEPESTGDESGAHHSDGTVPSVFDDSSFDEFGADSNYSSVDNLTNTSPHYSGAPSNSSITTKTGNTSNQSLVAATPVEDMRREARTLVPVPRFRLSKIQWHQFMDTPDDDFAKELTRIDWAMYCSIRPRDFVRHVSVKNTTHAHSKILEDVNRMINHFNHLSIFVEGMILLRDKPKHRAKALEKFMSIAWKLRQQNNYNALASVLSAVNGTAVYRLALTKALVPEDVLKQFMRLIILMSTQRSHAAYRLAWENSPSERIPYLALLRRDLIAAEDGNMTFIGPEGSLINWKKFEIMGQTIIGIQKSQERPFYFPHRNEEVMKLVLETKILEGDMVSRRWKPDPF
jgi:hypothetical protein